MISQRTNRSIFKIVLLLLLSFLLLNTCERLEIAELVKIVTRPPSFISYHEAVLSGAVIDFGGRQVLQHGHCWAIHDHPSMFDAVTQHSSLEIMEKPRQFSSEIKGLQPGTTYFYCAYCYDGKETFYGEILNFKTTPATTGIVTTSAVDFFSADSAQCGGIITNDGGDSIVARGVCWDTLQEPTVDDKKTFDGKGLGSFKSILRELVPDTKYYVRAYATNKVGTSYGDELSFKTKDGIPVLSTRKVTQYTAVSAVSGGDVTSDGSLQVISKGVCWDITPYPVLTDFSTIDGEGLGSFVSNLSNLSPNTTYYVRAYATNSHDTAYGDFTSFTTLDGILSLTTYQIENITTNSASSGADIGSDEGLTVSSHGVCWNISKNPTIEDDTTNDGVGTGSFNSVIKGLEMSTTYYVRAYAINDLGASYGNERSFVTSFIDDRDSRIYKCVQIGEKIWMAENLAFLPAVSPPSYESWDSPVYYVYDYIGTNVSEAKNTENYIMYGVLYNWPAAMDGGLSSNLNPSGVQGICPAGWHLPSDAEWTELSDFLGGTAVAGGKMKETGYDHWSSPNAAATNSSGFSALPGGLRGEDGPFTEIQITGGWWSATSYNSEVAWRHLLQSCCGDIQRGTNTFEDGYSVRCVKD